MSVHVHMHIVVSAIYVVFSCTHDISMKQTQFLHENWARLACTPLDAMTDLLILAVTICVVDPRFASWNILMLRSLTLYVSVCLPISLSVCLCVCPRYYVFVFSERELTFTFAICYRLSVCLSVCRLSSVTLVRPTQAVQIFGNISTALGIFGIHWKFYGDPFCMYYVYYCILFPCVGL